MNRTQKHTEIEAIRDRFGRVACAVLTDFRGLNVETINKLRSEFRKAGIEYKVVKNTLVQQALENDAYADDLSRYLNGPTAIAWSYEDVVAPAKIAVDFSKDHENLKIKCGVMDGEILDSKAVVKLSKMPGKDEMRSMLLATFMAPAQGFVRLLTAGSSEFVRLLDARRQQIEKE